MPEIMTHTIVLGLSIAAVVSMAAMLNIIREDSMQNSAQVMTENICAQIKIAAEQLKSSSQTSTALLELPNKIGGRAYSIQASEHAISISTSGASHNCVAGTAEEIDGVASGGNIALALSGNAIRLSGA